MLRKSLNKEALSSKSNTIPSSCTLQITEFYTKCRVLRHTCFCTCLCLEYILRLQQRGVGLSKSFKCQINILQMEKTAIFRKQIQNSLITEFKSSFFAFWAKWILQNRKVVWLLNIVGTIWKYLGWNIHGKSHNNGTGLCFINMAKSDWVILNMLMQSNVSHTLKAFASCWHWHYTTSFLWITTTSVSEHIYRKDEKTS